MVLRGAGLLAVQDFRFRTWTEGFTGHFLGRYRIQSPIPYYASSSFESLGCKLGMIGPSHASKKAKCEEWGADFVSIKEKLEG